MSDTGSEAPPDDAAAPSAAGGEPAAGNRTRRIAIGLAVGVAVLVAGVALSPYWAPPLAPLLPWGGHGGASNQDLAALRQRLAALEAERGAATALKPVQDALAQRLARIEAADDATRQQLQQLKSRLDGAAQQLASLGTADAAVEKTQQELSRLGTVAGDLGNRVAALEKAQRAQLTAGDTVAPLLAALLQIREAVDAGRPFVAAYSALAALAKDRPDIAAAAAPLSPVATDGAPGRAALARRLDALADTLANAAAAPPSTTGWKGQILAQLRGLVTIRRLAEAGPAGPQAVVAAAQKALAAGDLGGAIGSLSALDAAAAAAAAQPWLRLARQQLAAETALARLQGLLTTQIEARPPNPAPPPPPPAKAPS